MAEVPATQQARTSESGFPVKPVYHPDDVGHGLADRRGEPGDFPFTRGIRPTM